MKGLHLFEEGDGVTRMDGVNGVVTEASVLWATIAWETGVEEEVEQGASDVWAFRLDDPHFMARVQNELATLLSRETHGGIFGLTTSEEDRIEALQEQIADGPPQSEDRIAIEESFAFWAAAGVAADELPLGG
jgi:hypothetical protein